MPDVIKLLPDSVANQIAAGEVIQRPASAVKELLENAIDSGAGEIKLYVKEAGRVLIQIVDNGCGMSVTDARLAFERHATSKIREASDLFAIRTLGFRGEALASIAAVAQVQLKTRRHEDELATQIEIEGSVFKSQHSVASSPGTSIMVKNLFFNVPARRNFLKSNTIELRHIVEEFQRVALVYPDVAFSLYNNDKPMFVLSSANLKQRIIALMGNHLLQRLLPVNEDAQEVKLQGFVGKPEFARKLRGEQYFFVNKRFIRNAYLHHAVVNAFQELIPDDAHPSYFLYLEVDPASIDINIHPTKTEVNFQHGQFIYNLIKSGVRQALGKFSLAPSIDFDEEQSIKITPLPPGYIPKQPQVNVDPDYNPFTQQTYAPQSQAKPVGDDWKKLLKTDMPSQPGLLLRTSFDEMDEAENIRESKMPESSQLLQINGRYILSRVKSGMMIIDQCAAHQRILYDKFLHRLEANKPGSQQSLFPQTMNFSGSDADIIRELNPQLLALGFVLEPLGTNSFVLNGMPGDIETESPVELLERIIDNYKRNLAELKSDRKTGLARSMARQMAIKAGKTLTNDEMLGIVNQLFATAAPEMAPDGSPTLRIITINEIAELFKR